MSQYNNTLRTGLIAINNIIVNGKTIEAVNARELHAFLEISKVFGAWIQERIAQYDFIENQDYIVFSKIGKNPMTGGRPIKDYHISLDMAKELSMVERNAKGKEARQYFIECERQAKTAPTLAPSDSSIMSDSIVNAIIAQIKTTLPKTISTLSDNIMNVITGTLKNDLECITAYKEEQQRIGNIQKQYGQSMPHIENYDISDTVIDKEAAKEAAAYALIKEILNKPYQPIKKSIFTNSEDIPKSFRTYLNHDHGIDSGKYMIAHESSYNTDRGYAVMPSFFIENRQVIWTEQTPKHALWFHALRCLGKIRIDNFLTLFDCINQLAVPNSQGTAFSSKRRQEKIDLKRLRIIDTMKFTDIQIVTIPNNAIVDKAYVAPLAMKIYLTPNLAKQLTDYPLIADWASDAITCPNGQYANDLVNSAVLIPCDAFLIACIYREFSAPRYNK